MNDFRKCSVFYDKINAGILAETDSGYSFVYLPDYLKKTDACPVSLTLPLQEEAYLSKTLFSFFDGLIPEGWLLDITVATWKLNVRDRFGLLLASGRDCIGAVTLEELN